MLDCLVGECNANCLTCFSCPCSYDVGDVLIRLQKINCYITFCEEHQYNKFYEEDLIEYAVLEIHFKYEPTKGLWFWGNRYSGKKRLGIAIK